MALGDRLEKFVDGEEIELSFGYSAARDDNLIIPVKLENRNEFREIMTRESMYSFPAAAVGTVILGPAGTVIGHVSGTTAGIVRHKRIHPDDNLFESESPEVVEDG